MKERIQHLAKINYEKIVTYRRHFHTYPELSNQEFQTAVFIQNLLTDWHIPFQAGIAGTGIVALLKGKNPDKKVIALRADMDALPITECNSVDYQSKNKGVMHACGHDVHMASLLGSILILKELTNEFEGTIKFIFQPCEEALGGGADVMIAEGVLENPAPKFIYGQHVFPELEVGKVGFKEGIYMASTDELYLTVKGKGGHAGTPHLNIDPVLIAAHIIVGLQQIVSRNAFPGMPTVLSFGKIIGEGQTNIIPNEVKIAGTLRTFDEVWRKKVHEKLTFMAQNMASAMGGECEVEIGHGYPFLTNDVDFTKRSSQWAKEFLGEEKVVELQQRMTAEDFAYFSQVMPGCFYRLGIRNEEKGIVSNLHTNTFDIDEKALETGSGLMAWLAINELAY